MNRKRGFLLLLLLLVMFAFAINGYAETYIYKDKQGSIHASTNKPSWWKECCLILVEGKTNVVDEVKTKANYQKFQQGEEFLKSQKDSNQALMYVSITDGETKQKEAESSQSKEVPKNEGVHFEGDRGSPELLEKRSPGSRIERQPPPPRPHLGSVEKPTGKEMEIYEALQKDLFIDNPDDPIENSFRRIAGTFGISIDRVKEIREKVKHYKMQENRPPPRGNQDRPE